MKQYLDLLKKVILEGQEKNDRTGVGTRSIFGHQMRFNLKEGFPLVTTKKIHFKSIVHELLWFISGDTNIKYLQDNGVRIWNEWADENGDLGPVYGAQWRRWKDHNGVEHDQLKWLINEIKTNPDSRRLILSAWNVGQLSEMALPPCHCFVQFYVQDGKLSCHLYQRSADVFLGVPFNIASYTLLTMMMAEECDLDYRELIYSTGDTHLYNNHLKQALEQIKRDPNPLPKVRFAWGKSGGFFPSPISMFDKKASDIELIDYKCHPHIKAEVAI